MKLRHLMTAALGALVLSCQGPAAVLAYPVTDVGRRAVGAQPDGAVSAERAREEALRRLPA